MRSLLFIGLLLMSAAAFANPVGLSVGETKNVKVSQRIAQVEVSQGQCLEVTHQGSNMKITGREPGRTSVRVTTVDGAEVSLDVHVLNSGGRVFVIRGPAGAGQ